MSVTENFEPDDFILGPDMPLSVTGMMAAGVEALRLTPVMVGSSDGEYAVWDGSAGTAVGLTCFAVVTTDEPKGFSYYNKGSFRATSISWPEGITDGQKQTSFAGTAISIG